MQIGQEHNSGPKYTLAPDPEDRNRQFPGIWHNYYPRLSVYLRRVFGIAEQEDIEELVQETLLKVYRNLDRYDSKHALSTWVYRIGLYTGMNWQRKRAADAFLDPITAIPEPAES